jgi:hypothetical protein
MGADEEGTLALCSCAGFDLAAPVKLTKNYRTWDLEYVRCFREPGILFSIRLHLRRE